jgi:benzoyl-CoA reductase/2-hydroxyglutaryl-CoA dehydratase subunit BcrC/BadD/HgdB
MSTKETLEAVNVGVLTDEQLKDAIKHYTELEKNLKCHGEVYHLVWKDVYMTLHTLNGFKDSRERNSK